MNGAFEFFYNDVDWQYQAVKPGDEDQGTGEEVKPTYEAPVSVRGSLDAATSRDLRDLPAGQLLEGTFRFYTERSYGMKPGGLLKNPKTSEAYRILQRVVDVPMLNDTAGTDAVCLYVELVHRGR